MSLRVVIVTRIPPVLTGFDAVVREAGHEPVAFLERGAQQGRGQPVHRSGSIQAVTRRASRLWKGSPE